ncbi:VOC family protein [Salsipaludibacter albus]|uniref:VOC family protein n=1 Tax=Salsipaludibacter albus TaxID=2849650 RepID=UPI001EE3DF6C|nr:VOC family protein [Salsipaludibacter albus]MBY5162651.1 VOC family protein [Salsipaludibacter albus]
MGLTLRSVVFEAREPARVAEFWAALLGRRAVRALDGVMLAGDETQVGLRFVRGSARRRGRQLHLHLTSARPDDQDRTVARALELGGRPLDVGQLPEEDHVVVADPEGNPFCVIEAGNGYLAGCGFLGEVACDGTRSVGHFWRDALGWGLVWDQDEETAIQSPLGGTKVAWGGPPVVDKVGRNEQRFDLVISRDTMAREVERLVSLGARRRIEGDDVVELTDPDDNEFTITGT